MVRKLIEWAVGSALVVLLLTFALAGFGVYAWRHVNVEAYPDPAPAIVEVVAQYPGFSAEEVERLVTIPLEIALAGMPGLKYTRSKSLAGLSHLRNQFDYGVDYYAARQEVINRLALLQNLPSGVNPQISPFTPTGELMRYTISGPKRPLRPDPANRSGDELYARYTQSDRPGESGQDVYSLLDFKALQDWVLAREFRRVPRIIDVTGFGGMVKRYEICPDPEELKRYGITLQQFQNAISNSNANIGAGYLRQGPVAMNVRALGLIGQGQDPMQQVMTLPSPYKAERLMRQQERQRVKEIREVVVVSVNNVPVHVGNLVRGANDSLDSVPVKTTGPVGAEGVLVNYQPRLGKVAVCHPKRDEAGQEVRDKDGNLVWVDEEDKVQGVVLMRKNEPTLLALQGAKNKVKELNETAGRLLPGTELKLHFDLTGLLHRTTETVQENLIVGMVLVTVILLMFLSNVRSALIVAINIPLALLFAFSVLFVRGKSANLLSIGAVDFGIIVDSSVIMVENIYRHLSAGENADLPLKDRITLASHEVERALFFSTAIMVCAFLPLFTMQGPEGQIFGPMADTYAFALAGALLMALTLAPVLCLLFFRNLKPTPDNFLVRWMKAGYLRQLDRCLRYRFLTLTLFVGIIAVTVAALPMLGREFMPELEEGNLYIRGTFPVNISLEEAADKARRARTVMRQFPEVALVQSQVGRPDDGTDPTGFYNVEFSIPLRPEEDWPRTVQRPRWQQTLLGWWLGPRRARTKPELVKAMNDELDRTIIGVDWNFSQYIRDNVMESLSGVKGDNSVKIIGPDLDELERLAYRVKTVLNDIQGVANPDLFRIKGQPNLNFTVDRERCSKFGVSVADVQNAIKIAVGGSAFTQMIEGEKTFDITLRWPERLRGNEQAILQIPIDITNNYVTAGYVPSTNQTPVSGPSSGISTIGTSMPMPSLFGNIFNAAVNNISSTPRLRLGQVVLHAALVELRLRGPAGAAGRRLVADLQQRLQRLDFVAGVRCFTVPGERFALLSFRLPDRDNLYRVQDELKLLVARPYELKWTVENLSHLDSGASTIYREQGKRLIALKFSVRDRDLGSTVAEAQEKVAPLIPKGYATEWSGEFQQMLEAEHRLMWIVPVSLGLICIMLYLAFHNLLDVLAVFSNVIALCLGGVWALLLTGHNFSISAAVGFISIFGVAIMDGLLLISYFNALRAQGYPLREAILTGAEKRVRPVMMTALTAIFGLLPAALSTKIGSQTQRPLAIVVVGGMITTLFLTRYLMPVLYSFYGHREPLKGAGGMAH
jgi:cobalt-zinc-cadmium resistance protein CzcA